MAGTKAGGIAASITNKKKYGADFYAKIGAQGGKLGKTGGFYADRDNARRAGSQGGRFSRKGLKFIREANGIRFYENLASGTLVKFKVNRFGDLVPVKK